MPNDIETGKLELEREKWAADLELRKAALEVSRQEQATKQSELELKRAEVARSKWNSPLVVAILAAALAGIANVGVTAINDMLQRRTENQKAEDGRILEMIKTGDTKTASTNLQFLADTGLITGADRLTRLKEYLASHPNSGPVLPPGSDRFGIERTPSLTSDLEASLSENLRRYEVYFDQVGFTPPTANVSVSVERIDRRKNPGWYSYYDDSANKIVIDPLVAKDPDIVTREYSHHVLIRNTKNDVGDAAVARIESSLADYFVCSFFKRSEFGQIIAAALKLQRPYFKDLGIRLVYTPIHGSIDEGNNLILVNNSTTWGNVFWAIHEKLGQSAADRILATAWRVFVVTRDRVDETFAAVLLKSAGDEAAPIRAILADRQFPIPS